MKTWKKCSRAISYWLGELERSPPSSHPPTVGLILELISHKANISGPVATALHLAPISWCFKNQPQATLIPIDQMELEKSICIHRNSITWCFSTNDPQIFETRGVFLESCPWQNDYYFRVIRTTRIWFFSNVKERLRLQQSVFHQLFLNLIQRSKIS